MMISLKRLKELVKKEKKSLSREAIRKIQTSLEESARGMIKKAARKSDFAGRKTIKEKDLVS